DNHNGLCETGEHCIYAPNFGAYQGTGTLSTCTFQNGTVTGVTMYGYSTIGYGPIPAAPSITFAASTITAYNGTPVTDGVTTTGGAILSCTVSPPLPAGLSLNVDTCQITGTPTALQGSATYTITAANLGGSVQTTVQISVIAPNLSVTVAAA